MYESKPALSSTFRQHVCVLQSDSKRQTWGYVHSGFASQRCVFLSISTFLTHVFQYFLFSYNVRLSYLSADCSKTFRVSLGSDQSPQEASQLHPLFIPIGQCTQTSQSLEIQPGLSFSAKMHSLLVHSRQMHKYKQQCVSSCSSINVWCADWILRLAVTVMAVLFLYVGYYILVYLQGYFLHCINTRQQEMLCHSLFLSGETSWGWEMSAEEFSRHFFCAAELFY